MTSLFVCKDFKRRGYNPKR